MIYIFIYFFLRLIAYALPICVFAKCFTCAPTSPISNELTYSSGSAATTPIESDVSGNLSIIPFLFATSKYPFSQSSAVNIFLCHYQNSLTHLGKLLHNLILELLQ